MNKADTNYDYIYKAIINCERSIKLLKDSGSDTKELEVKLMKLRLQANEINPNGEFNYRQSLQN